MANNITYILRLENLSKQRALTEPESRRLERLLKQESLIPLTQPKSKLCFYGHLVDGKNAMPNEDGSQQCKKCFKKNSHELDIARRL